MPSLAQQLMGIVSSTVVNWQSVLVRASSLRAPLRGELLPITVTTSSKTFVVPDAWKGSFVNIQADGGDLFIQVSTTATPAAVDKDARAQEAGSPIALTPPASGNGCVTIFNGQTIPVPFPSNATTFALQGSANCCARTHPSET